MFMVIMGHINLFKLLRTEFQNIEFNILPQIQEHLLLHNHLAVLSYSHIILEPYLFKTFVK